MLAAIGFGVMSMNRMTRMKSNNFHNYSFIARDKALVNILTHLEKLKQSNAFYEMIEKINRFLELGYSTDDSNDVGFIMNRLSNEINEDAQRMCTIAKSSKDIEILNTVVDCEDELLPALETICQNTLRNMLLRRM